MPTYNIKNVDPKTIAFNDENVRGESEQTIEADDGFQRLKESIYNIGVLVPLVVKNFKKNGKGYLLLDGERRLRAALSTNQEKVPVHVLSDVNKDNEILYQFQIHMLRKEWTRVAQARVLKHIKENIIKKYPGISEDELFNKINNATGYRENVLKDLFRVLHFVGSDDTVLDELESDDSDVRFSHLVQLEASFIEQLDKVYPELITKYGKQAIRAKMLDKVRSGIIIGTREPMEKLLPLFGTLKNIAHKKHLKGLLERFISNREMSCEQVAKEYVVKFPVNEDNLIKLVEYISERIIEVMPLLHNIKVIDLKSYPKLETHLKKQLNALGKVVNKKRRELK